MLNLGCVDEYLIASTKQEAKVRKWPIENIRVQEGLMHFIQMMSDFRSIKRLKETCLEGTFNFVDPSYLASPMHNDPDGLHRFGRCETDGRGF